MEWRDDGWLVACSFHGEHAALCSVLTEKNGLWRGLVHGAHSQKKRALLQIGVPMTVSHRARVKEQLGVFTIEPCHDLGVSYRLHRGQRLAILSSACSLVARLCPEHQPHEKIFLSLHRLFSQLDEGDKRLMAHHYVLWEYDFLASLGYGMDISHCALSGARGDVAFVSKKSGRGIRRDQWQESWRHQVLKVPPFLSHYGALSEPSDEIPNEDDIRDGLALTAHFLSHHATDQSLPAVRQWIGSSSMLQLGREKEHRSRSKEEEPNPSETAQ